MCYFCLGVNDTCRNNDSYSIHPVIVTLERVRNKIIIIFIKRCLILGYMICNDLVLLFSLKMFVSTTTIIKAKRYVSSNNLIFAM